jgi:dihydrofolate reductase
MPTRHAIFAQSLFGYIGKRGNHPLLWKLKGDLPRFKALTDGAAIIMGRHTMDSLPGLLPNRFHIVVSRTLAPGLDGDQNVAVVSSLDQAFALASEYGYEDQFVIGGGDLLNEAIPYCHKIHRTVVLEREPIDGDMSMVALPMKPPHWGRFTMDSIEEHHDDETGGYDFEVYTQPEPLQPK